MKRIIKFILCFLLLIPISTKAIENYHLLGLGDSITTGYGISDSKDIYINILKDYLIEYYPNIILDNKAINGLTSKDLLNNIQNDKSLQDKIKYANMIVMSIGGNDYLREIIYNQNSETFINIGNQLLNNLKSIYDNIFSLNESVNLIVIPLYNPYIVLLKNNQALLEIYDKTKKDIINQIKEYQTTTNKKIYTSDALSEKIESGNNLNLGIDPHPNLNGHKLIAEECIRIYNEKIMIVDVSKENKLKSVTNFLLNIKIILLSLVFLFLLTFLKKVIIKQEGDNMPELPEVETVKETLKKQVLHKQIIDTNIYYEKIIDFPKIDEFKKDIKNQTINNITRRGKWLMFELDDYYLLSHLRMEGKYFLKTPDDTINKHEHLSFILNNGQELRYHDTRKFGRMHLIKKEDIKTYELLNELGLEPWDTNLNIEYLKSKYKNKSLPVKTVLLDQSIIVGIGNIYADEILFLSNINPLKKCNKLTNKELQLIIDNIKTVLDKAIELGGTTIRSYTSSEGVHGRFQNELKVHGKETCSKCNSNILKIRIGGRGTYYCPKCQKKR